MPGSSLWLIPPESALDTVISHLIHQEIPSLFPSAQAPAFIPHITLTSFIPPENKDTPSAAHAWLSLLDLPSIHSVTIQQPEVGDMYFQKLTLACQKTESLKALAEACRAQGTEDSKDETANWAEKDYYPHMSLMYSNIESEHVNTVIHAIRRVLRQAWLQSPELRTAKGGAIALVPTDRPIEEWQPVATREVPDLEWSWEVKY